MRPSPASALVAASLLLAGARPALAAPTDPSLAAARALFHDAEADEQAERWDDALAKLHRASAVKMTPGIRFHIALCEERLGHLAAALDDYVAAQAQARREGNREVLALVSEPLLAIKVRVPTLTVELPPGLAGAEIRLDGAPLAAALVGAPVSVEVGSHTVQASAPGQAPYAATVTLVERQAETVRVQFVPLAAPPPTPAAPSPPPEPAPPQGTRTLAIVATAAAVGLVAGGVGAFAAAGSDQSYWRAACKGQGPSCGNATPVRAWDATALGAWIAGAGAGALAVVLWVSPAGASPNKIDGPRARLSLGPGTAWLTGTF